MDLDQDIEYIVKMLNDFAPKTSFENFPDSMKLEEYKEKTTIAFDKKEIKCNWEWHIILPSRIGFVGEIKLMKFVFAISYVAIMRHSKEYFSDLVDASLERCLEQERKAIEERKASEGSSRRYYRDTISGNAEHKSLISSYFENRFKI